MYQKNELGAFDLFLVLVIASFFLLPSCSSIRQKVSPSIFPQLQKPVEELVPRPISDADVLYFAEGIKSVYGGRSFAAQVTDVGGAVTMSGLSTGAMLANAGQASPTVISAVVAASAFLAQVFGIVDPATRANALSEGASLVRDAENEFILCMVNAGQGTPEKDKITPCGANLFVKTNAAVSTTERIIVGLLPKWSDLEELRSSVPLIVKPAVPAAAAPNPSPAPASN